MAAFKRISAVQFNQLAKAKKELPDDTIVIKTEIGVSGISDAGRQATFKISSSAIDRDNDTINPKGWNLDNYKKNPVVLWGHKYDAPPIATCPSISLKGGDLLAQANFFSKDVYEWADTIYKIVKAGGLRASSVGFRPIDFDYNKSRGGTDIHTQELLEWSIVPIPSNPEALLMCAATAEQGDEVVKAFIKQCEDFLDEHYGGKGVWVPREQVEKTFEAINKSGVFVPVQIVRDQKKEVPSPEGGETEATFMSRCMSDATMQQEFPDQDQRTAVCMRQLSGKQAPAPATKAEEPLYLDIIDEALVFELSGEYVDIDQKGVQEILAGIIKHAVEAIGRDVHTEVRAQINRARGRVD